MCKKELTSRSKIDVLIDHYGQDADVEAGKIFGGRYMARARVGTGGMARVYLAEDRKTGGVAALKILEKSARGDKEPHERFFREAHAAAKIRHPNIVDIFDSGVHEDGTPYLAMEFLFGETLGQLLKRKGTLPSRHALVVVHNAAAGLEAAHRAGIIHRDVKPDNIFLIGAEGQPYGVKVVDFGLAKLIEAKQLTAAGTAVGTVAYMAPEQVVADPTDARTDVYGLGVVMYRALAGILPFVSKDQAIMLASHLIVEPPEPRARVASLDAATCAVVKKALRKRPENRYASMRELREDIERLTKRKDGALLANAPLTNDPDVYVPRHAFSRSAAGYFYKKLGSTTPQWK
jgi:serine/threonine-protein kinase